MFFSADSTLLLAVANPGGYASLLVAPLQLRRGSCDPLLPLLHRHLNLRLMRLIILPHRLRAVQLLLPNRPVNRIPALRQPLQRPAVPSYRQPLRISLPPNRKKPTLTIGKALFVPHANRAFLFHGKLSSAQAWDFALCDSAL